MKVKTFRRGGYGNGGFRETGGDIYGKALLHEDPVQPLQAATVNYVEEKASDISSGRFAIGVLPEEVMPALAGDIESQEGSVNLSLNPIGVIAGSTHTKVLVNDKGQVTSGAVMVESDIPQLDFSKLENTPTTFEDYGITDVLPLTGGTIIGNLSIESAPESPEDLVNLAYLTQQGGGSGGSGVMVGGTIYRNTPDTPEGYLRCNGSFLSKTTYSELYSVIGDAFGVEQTPGNGKPHKYQYSFNNEQTDTLVGWETLPGIPGALGYSQAIVTKNRVYMLGGFNGSWVNAIYTTTIDSEGNLGTWSSAGTLPTNLSSSQAIVTKNRVYLLGGHNGTSPVSIVRTAPINEDGTIGAWTTVTSLPGALSNSQAVITKNRVYLLGGQNASGYTATVYTAPIDSEGIIGAWTTGTSLPDTNVSSHAILTKNRAYLLGRYTGSSVLSTVYTAPVNSDGIIGTWTTGTSLPIALTYSEVVTTENRVFLFGGNSGSGAISTVLTAPINSDGTLGTWVSTTPLPVVLALTQAIIVKNYIYLISGTTTGGYTTNVFRAPFKGGMNDYSNFYNGNMLPASTSTNFKLPNPNVELNGAYAYIKY